MPTLHFLKTYFAGHDNPSTQKAEAGRCQAEASLVYVEFQANLGCTGKPKVESD